MRKLIIASAFMLLFISCSSTQDRQPVDSPDDVGGKDDTSVATTNESKENQVATPKSTVTDYYTTTEVVKVLPGKDEIADGSSPPDWIDNIPQDEEIIRFVGFGLPDYTKQLARRSADRDKALIVANFINQKVTSSALEKIASEHSGTSPSDAGIASAEINRFFTEAMLSSVLMTSTYCPQMYNTTKGYFYTCYVLYSVKKDDFLKGWQEAVTLAIQNARTKASTEQAKQQLSDLENIFKEINSDDFFKKP